MGEHIVSLDGDLGLVLSIACPGDNFLREKIVRCKDCAYKSPAGDCYRLGHNAFPVEPEGFCAWAKRFADYVAKLDYSNKHNTCNYPNAHGQVEYYNE